MNKIARLILASGESSPDMRYAAGFSTPDEFLYFSTDRERGVICSPLEFSRAVAQTRDGVTVHAEAEFGGPDRLEMLTRLAASLGVAGYLVPSDFPVLWADKLRGRGLEVRVESGVFFPQREFKSAAEVEAVVRSQRAGEAGLLRESEITPDRLIRWRGKLLTSEILRSEIDVAMVRLGMLPTGTICAGGEQAAQPHNTGSGPLRADWPIVMDIFPRSAETGYWGDLTRTVVKGRASELVRRAYDAVLAARELGKSLVKVGADPAEIHLAAARKMEEAGFRTGRSDKADFGFFHGLGHALGQQIAKESGWISTRRRVYLRATTRPCAAAKS